MCGASTQCLDVPACDAAMIVVRTRARQFIPGGGAAISICVIPVPASVANGKFSPVCPVAALWRRFFLHNAAGIHNSGDLEKMEWEEIRTFI